MNPEYNEYFEQVARNHKLIGHSDEEQHFVHVEMGELENDLVTRLKTPVLAITSPTYQGAGQHANLRWRVTGGLFILERLKDQNDFKTGQALIQSSRIIAEQIASKMVKDRKLWIDADVQHVLPGLDEGSFEIRPLHFEWRPMVGVMMTFNYNLPRDRFDVNDWNNEIDYR